jgi:HK97 family phage major capsid protein
MSKLSQRIAELRKARGEKVTAYEAVVTAALDGDRDLTAEETTTRDALKAELEKIDRDLDRLEADEQMLAVRAVRVQPGREDREVPAEIVSTVDANGKRKYGNPTMDAYTGAGFTRMAIAIAVAGIWNAASYAEQRWGDKAFAALVARAAVAPINSTEAVGAGGGSALVTILQMQSEFIDLLRPALILPRLPSVRHLEFLNNGSIRIPKQTGGVVGGYIGEGQSIPVNRLSFGQLNLTPSKLAVIVPQTNEFLRRSDPSSEQLVQADMIEGTAATVDGFFFSSTAAANNPAGILTGVAHNVAGDIPLAATVSQVSDALRAMIGALVNANIKMTAPAWIMHPRTKLYLQLLRTVPGEFFGFKAELDQGLLLGYPVITSTSISLNFGGTAGDAPYALIDCAELVFAEDMGPVIDASQEASIQSDSAPATPPAAPYYSAFQNDMTFMRLRMSHTWARRRDEAVTWAVTKV